MWAYVMDTFYDNINIINILIVRSFTYIDFMLFNYVARGHTHHIIRYFPLWLDFPTSVFPRCLLGMTPHQFVHAIDIRCIIAWVLLQLQYINKAFQKLRKHFIKITFHFST